MLLAILTAAGCIDPATYGALPDDNKPDSAGLQLAINAALVAHEGVCLRKGVYNLERVPRNKAYGSLMLTQGPIEISGVGKDSVIRMTGSGGRRDWRAFEIKGAHGVFLHDFTIDGLDAYDTVEQTHLIDVTFGSTNIMITHMVLGPMRKPTDPVGGGIGGDCIRLLGKPGEEVVDVFIDNNKLINCDRSGISFQRALREVFVAHTTITDTGDQAIDFEPTGNGDIQDVLMLDLTVKHHANAQGADAIAIGGNKDYRARRITLMDSHVEGGAVRLLDVEDVQLVRNTINFGNRQKKKPLISVLRRADRVLISQNTLTRPRTAAPGAIVMATHLDKSIPHGLVFEGNKVRQETSAPVLKMVSVGGLEVRGNKIDYTGADTTIPLVTIAAVAADVEDVVVTGNEITGEAGAIVSIANRDHQIRHIDVRGNQAARMKESIRCRGTAAGFKGISSDDKGLRIAACKGVQLSLVRTPPPR